MPQGSNKTREITFRKDDEWVLEYLTEIVSTKRELGIRTSLSYEIVRLCKNSLLEEMRGGELDRMILSEKLDAIRERLGADLSGLADEPTRIVGEVTTGGDDSADGSIASVHAGREAPSDSASE